MDKEGILSKFKMLFFIVTALCSDDKFVEIVVQIKGFNRVLVFITLLVTI